MSSLLRGLRVLRNHWKKSTLGFALISYGLSYAREKYRMFQLMRTYCEEAKLFGEESVPCLNKVRHITVILNPVAHDGKARSLYERFSAPLMHLAGLKVSVIETEIEGQAKDLMEIMDNTDAVVIAGGNGTLHEAVTGLLRRRDIPENGSFNLPLGIVPAGKTNTAAKHLFWTENSSNAEWFAEATMAVIRQTTTAIDVMKIKGEKGKPVFAVSDFEMGLFSDLENSLSKYWYFGPLKAKIAYIVNSWKDWPLTDEIHLEYTSPCSGCSKCYSLPVSKDDHVGGPKRWWSPFIPKAKSPLNNKSTVKDFSNVVNDDCGLWHPDEQPFSNIIISTATGLQKTKDQGDALLINKYPSKLTSAQFISTGWKHHKRNFLHYQQASSSTFAKELKFTPNETKESWFYIDSENYEAQPVHISLLPKHLIVYAKVDK